MLNNVTELSRRAQRPLVIFDLEHTGGKKGSRGITDFAAQVVAPDGTVTAFSSLVRPSANVPFNPIVMRLTKITPRTVAGAPAWRQVAEAFVKQHQDSVWVGFNSNSCDLPVILEECEKNGIAFTTPKKTLDLMRLSPFSGSLSVQVAKLLPSLDTSGAHRAAKDAWMTMWLLEALLPHIPRKVLEQRLEIRTAAWVARQAEVPTTAVQACLVREKDARKAAPWAKCEKLWIAQTFQKGTALGELARLTGRPVRAIAEVVSEAGLIGDSDRLALKVV